MAIDIVEAMVQAEDPANKAIVGHNVTRSMRLMMFTETVNAQWAADRFIKSLAYPLATLSFSANRNVFRLQVGDNFKWSSSRLGIRDMVFRIIKITEENLISEVIKIEAIEDVEYSVGAATFNNIPVGSSPRSNRSEVTKVDNAILFEAPYVIAGNDIQIIPVIEKKNYSELGFLIYMSLTGDSYSYFAESKSFAIRGTLVNEYTSDTYEIDDTIGFRVAIPDFDEYLNSLIRVDLFGPTNLSILGDDTEAEIITWQTITPVSTGVYDITGVYRNRYGTDRKTHPVGTSFWFINQSYITMDDENFTYGNTVYFKIVSYNSRVQSALADADVYETTFLGVSRRPYDPTNFGCNDVYVTPTYTSDCVLTWSPRIRGDGLGLGNPDYVIENPSHEGYFEVEVYVNDILVRTESDIDTDTWTYTSAMNTTDNGALADTIMFKLRNYLDYEDIEYTSAWVTLTVNKE